MSKQTLFNELLDDLIDACVDYREAEHPGSGQGSWTRSQLYAGVLRGVRDVVDAVNQGVGGTSELGVGGTSELGVGGASNNGGGVCVPGGGQGVAVPPCICDEVYLTITCCAACGGAMDNE